MKTVKMIVLIGLVMIGAVYAGTRTDELSREEKNKIIVEMAIGAANAEDWDLMARLYAGRFVQHGRGDLKTTTWKQFELACRTVKQNFPTARFSIQDIVAEGDKVAVRGKTVITYKKSVYRSGTETKRVEFTEMDLYKIENDKIVEEWCEYDTADWETKARTLSRVKMW